MENQISIAKTWKLIETYELNRKYKKLVSQTELQIYRHPTDPFQQRLEETIYQFE